MWQAPSKPVTGPLMLDADKDKTTKDWHDMTMVQVSRELKILQDTYVSYVLLFLQIFPVIQLY